MASPGTAGRRLMFGLVVLAVLLIAWALWQRSQRSDEQEFSEGMRYYRWGEENLTICRAVGDPWFSGEDIDRVFHRSQELMALIDSRDPGKKPPRPDLVLPRPDPAKLSPEEYRQQWSEVSERRRAFLGEPGHGKYLLNMRQEGLQALTAARDRFARIENANEHANVLIYDAWAELWMMLEVTEPHEGEKLKPYMNRLAALCDRFTRALAMLADQPNAVLASAARGRQLRSERRIIDEESTLRVEGHAGLARALYNLWVESIKRGTAEDPLVRRYANEASTHAQRAFTAIADGVRSRRDPRRIDPTNTWSEDSAEFLSPGELRILRFVLDPVFRGLSERYADLITPFGAQATQQALQRLKDAAAQTP